MDISIQVGRFERLRLRFADAAEDCIRHHEGFEHLLGLAGVDRDDVVHILDVLVADGPTAETADGFSFYSTTAAFHGVFS